MTYDYYRDLGHCCHWCGTYCGNKPIPKTGKHRFCCKPCRDAHGRAFPKWEKKSEALKAAAARRAHRGPGRKSLPKKVKPGARSNRRSLKAGTKKSLAKKAKKRGMIRGKR